MPVDVGVGVGVGGTAHKGRKMTLQQGGTSKGSGHRDQVAILAQFPAVWTSDLSFGALIHPVGTPG